MAKVRADKLREASAGHDGTWVAHPGLAPVALEAFDAVMTGPNQLGVLREDVHVSAADLLQRARGRDHRGGPAPQHPRRRPVRGSLAARHRLRAAVQPDGGRRHRRDLAARSSGNGCGTAHAPTTAACIDAARFDQLLGEELQRDRTPRSGAKRLPAGVFPTATRLFDQHDPEARIRRFPDVASLRPAGLIPGETAHEHAEEPSRCRSSLRARLARQPALARHHAPLHAGGRRPPARLRAHRAFASRA